MKLKIWTFGLFLIASHCAFATGKGIGIRIPQSDVYLISIGVNQNQGSLFCNYCDNDALAISQRLEADSAHFKFRLNSYKLLNENATLAKLNEVFSAIAIKAKSADRIILYYSGVSVNLRHSKESEAENHFLLANADLNDSVGLTGDYFTIAMLKTWLDRIAANNFLLISDAGMTSAYISDFLTNLTNINSNWSKVDDKHRIFMYPNVAGTESNLSKRGNFSEILTGLQVSYSLADIFTKEEAVMAALKCAESSLFPDVAASNFSIKYFDEREFLQSYSFLLEQKQVKSRGGDMEDEDLADSIESYKRDPRRIAVVIGIDHYTYWDQLNNPVNDANTIGNILRDKYGFEIWRLTADPVVDDIINMIDSLSKQDLNGPMDQVFIFFAGHGFVDPSSGTGHLIAADSKKGTRATDVRSMIQHNYLINLLNSLPCKHLMLVIDACYSGSIQQAIGVTNEEHCDFNIPVNWKNLYSGLTNEQYIQRNMKCPTRRYITSGGKDYKVPDGVKGKHSPFADVLIKKLTNGDKTDGIVSYTEILPDLGYINPLPRNGTFGMDAHTSDFLFIEKRVK